MGQEQALEALEVGLALHGPGFNVFVSGASGTGRTFTVRQVLERLAAKSRRALDRVYVHNFSEPSRPRLLSLPLGRGRPFQAAMREVVESIPGDVERALENAKFKAERDAIIERHQSEATALLRSIDEKVSAAGLTTVQVQQGPRVLQTLAYAHDEKPVPVDVLRRDGPPRSGFVREAVLQARQRGEAIPTDPEDRQRWIDAQVDALETRTDALRRELEKALADANAIQKRARQEVRELETGAVGRVIGASIESLKADFQYPEVVDHLGRVLEHVLANLWIFTKQPGEVAFRDANGQPLGPWIYDVNVLQEDPEGDAAPVVVERHPTFTNLFGAIERKPLPQGGFAVDFTRIRGGSLLRADGGFLVLYAKDVLLEGGVWRNLVRTLRSGQHEVHPPEAGYLALSFALKPDPVPIDVKVVLIGDESLYHLLLYYEKDFPKIFKIKAEFDSSVERTESNVARFVETVCGALEKDSLLPLAPSAYAVLIEEAARQSGRRRRLSTQFGEVVDIAREAGFWACRADAHATIVDADAVRKALSAGRARHALGNERLLRAMREELVLISTDGARVGQINGLAVYGLGRHLFGKPSRITASVGVGPGHLVNIEREARLSGPSHDKGVMILTGYLRQTYAAARPLALTASIAFEQSYGGVDGDSASLAELYALLSALSGVAIRQGVAITGSVNQHGDAQAIGGVNEKVEGFFELCRVRGLTGEQGCVIPEANVDDLMLAPEVVSAVKAGAFNVWAIRTVDEGIPVLFEAAAPEVHERVTDRLRALAGQAASPTPPADPGDRPSEPAETPPEPPQDPRPPTPERTSSVGQ